MFTRILYLRNLIPQRNLLQKKKKKREEPPKKPQMKQTTINGKITLYF